MRIVGNGAAPRMVALIEAGEDPVVHFEDDAELTANFITKAEAEIEQHPQQVIQFFSRRLDDKTGAGRPPVVDRFRFFGKKA